MLERIYLVRHGQTEWSLSGRHTGRTDVPLTSRGAEQARALAARLRAVEFSRVFSSPRLRAWRTCELAGLAAAAETDPDLAEWDYGDYEGQRSVEIHQGRPGWNLFRDGAPGGESPEQVADRADRCITRLRGLEGPIALFSHGHFGRVLGARWIGLPVSQARHFFLATASLSTLGYEHDNPAEPVIASWNETRFAPDREHP